MSFQYNPIFETVVSADKMGMIEYWTGPKHDYKFPKVVDWEFKTETDLYEFAKVRSDFLGGLPSKKIAPWSSR